MLYLLQEAASYEAYDTLCCAKRLHPQICYNVNAYHNSGRQVIGHRRSDVHRCFESAELLGLLLLLLLRVIR